MQAGLRKVNDEIAARGHDMMQLGNSKLRCKKCAVTKSRLQFKYFLETQCENGSRHAPNLQRVQVRVSRLARIGTLWNEHRLVLTAFAPTVTYGCTLCKAQGSLSDFATDCKETQVQQDITFPTNLVGSRLQAKIANRKIAEKNAATRACNSRTLRTASTLWVNSLPPAGIEEEKPQWLSTLGEGHELFYIRGFSFCSKCGSVAAAIDTGSRLTKPCRGSMPDGSRSRINRIQKGHHPYKDQQWWPDGSLAEESGTVKKVGQDSLVFLEQPYEHEAAPQTESDEDRPPPPANWPTALVQSPPDEDFYSLVTDELDSAIDTFDDNWDRSHSYAHDVKVDLASLQELQQPELVRQCVRQYLCEVFDYRWRDHLQEGAEHVENQLSSFVGE